MSYTKGEWILEINKEENTVEIYCDEDCDLHPIATLRAGFGCRYMDEVTDNARLMAASPELLAGAQLALWIAESHIESEYSGTGRYAEMMAELEPARAAIAKATGAQP